MSLIEIKKPPVDQVHVSYKFHTTITVLRLDKIHPVISGNKWFKLRLYLEEATRMNKKILGTFGGAYSNHLLATAAAADLMGWKSIGIIRGERPRQLSDTLADAQLYGMQLEFVTRENYKNKKTTSSLHPDHPDDIYWIPEGGYGTLGAGGAGEILSQADGGAYDVIIAAVGTGTMIAGLTKASLPHQQIIGIPVLKNESLLTDIQQLLPDTDHQRVSLVSDYYFGGYAKKTKQLISFMNDWYQQTGIPSDFVYTGKLFYAVNDLLHKDFFSQARQILVVHSGGLQGNRSLPKGTLIF